MKFKTVIKILIGLVLTSIIIIGGILGFYLKGLPHLISNPKVINYVQDNTKKLINADLKIDNPELITSLSPDIEFKVDKIYLEKDDKKLLDLNKFNSAISFKDIFQKKIIIKKLVAESIFADIDEIQKIIPTKKEETKSEWTADIFDALLGVRKCEIIYTINNDTKIKLLGEHIGVNNALKVKKNVYVQVFADISRKGKHVTLKFKDNKRIYFKDKKFHIDNCPLTINNSNIFINLTADKKHNTNIELFSKNFNVNDILDFLNTQIIENNVQNSLVYITDIKGNIDFNLNITNNKFNGKFKLNNANFKVKDVDYIPITLTRGNVVLTTSDVKLSGFEGFYDNNARNKIDFEGDVKDYLKTIDTNITGNAIVRNDFFRKHLSKMMGTNVEIKGEAPTRIIFKSKNNIMDFVWLFMLRPGQNIKVGNDYLPFEDSLRLMKSDMHLEKMVLDIKSLDYHMIPADKIEQNRPKRGTPAKDRPKPIFKLKSKIDIAHNNNIKFINLEIPQPLPSELFNAIICQEIFKKGTIAGNITIDNQGKYPTFEGNMSMDRVIIPSQMTYIKEATLEAKDKTIHLSANGGYRYEKFSFDGEVLNRLTFPIIVKDVKLSLDNIDTLKMLEASSNQAPTDNIVKTDEGSVRIENNEDFDIRNIIIEQGNFYLAKGSYKEIEFSNLLANFTLDKNGVMDIKSNHFNFAQGYSSLRAKFDLINKKYNVKLGVRDVNSDLLANALLDLKREISGKGSGFLDISTDKSMKLSGNIKFIIKDGYIEKIGLVEYVLKCASLLRNTVTMISPGTLADIVSVPDGKFDKITGELNLNNNVVTGINIKTYSPQLSNYVAGRYNIENGDTSLRIYTKFSSTNKGITGFLRKLSLNTLANRLPMNSRNDANYYAIELAELPPLESGEKDSQIYLTRVEGDVVNNNYISSLKKLK